MSIIEQFKVAAELATGYKLQVLHDDKEGGLSGREFNTDLQSCGVTCPFTMRAEPHSNGKAESAALLMTLHLFYMSLTFHHHSGRVQ